MGDFEQYGVHTVYRSLWKVSIKYCIVLYFSLVPDELFEMLFHLVPFLSLSVLVI